MFRLTALLLGLGVSALMAQTRYEAEAAIPVNDHEVQVVNSPNASGGKYVEMRSGNLAFQVTVATAGFYTLWLNSAQPNDQGGKIQNLVVNGNSAGQISFPYSTTFSDLKAAGKIKLNAGANTIEITNSWGWVNIDYAEITPYQATPFTINPKLVDAQATAEAQQMFDFLVENFGSKTISGVMTNVVMQNDGKYSPQTIATQEEFAWIKNASGKYPALMGLDFMHSTGLNSDGEWHQGYNNATLALAQEIYTQGGIPIYCWHWKDPSQAVEAFYSPSSGNTPAVNFNLNRAFTDSTTYAAFNQQSSEYQQILADIDHIAAQLKILQTQKVPVLWRPLHEASGRWFWWGYKGPGATKALYRLLYDRLTNHHQVHNLIWVWTSDEASDALEWYPGDDVVDIVGRDFYYYPREANHSSLVASFENLKDIYGASKLIALSENGSVPYPDSMQADGANWSFFMPWYGDYAMDGWAHDNTAADWNQIMNHDFVITLEQMPGWDKYTTPTRAHSAGALQAQMQQGKLHINTGKAQQISVRAYTLPGQLWHQATATTNAQGAVTITLPRAAAGIHILVVQAGSTTLRRAVYLNP